MYASSVPVTSESFRNREGALARLSELLLRLKQGQPSWLAVIGARKIGKTSLLLEFERRQPEPHIPFVTLDVLDEAPLTLGVFRRYAMRIVDRCLGGATGVSLEAAARSPDEYRAGLVRSPNFSHLPADLQRLLLELSDRKVTLSTLRDLLDLPERIAVALDLRLLVALDEFQELASLDGPGGSRGLMAAMRSAWQRHRRVAYVISGSARSMLTDLVTSEKSPFFQHFDLVDIGPFARKDAVELLVHNAPPGCRITTGLAERIVDLFGGHPFYLQVLGEALTRLPPPLDEAALKQAASEVLFSRTGRLALYFHNEWNRLVGSSSTLAAVLSAVAPGPARLADIARTIKAVPAAAASYLKRLNDAVVRDDDGLYRVADPVFGMWLAWRGPGGTALPMKLFGDEAEAAVAEALAGMGFDLIYQSRASRGAFDLLAIRGASQMGVQVKHGDLPVYVSASAWQRMEGDAQRFGWRWVMAVARTGQPVTFVDPRKAKRSKKGASSAKSAAIDNLLLWLDGGGKPRRRTTARPATRRQRGHDVTSRRA